MSVYVRNLVVEIGMDFSEDLELYQSGGNVINLTNFTGYSHLRKNPESSSHVSIGVSFTDRTNGAIRLSLGSTITSNLKPGRYVYDLMLIRPNTSRTIALEGNVLVRAGISSDCF